MNGTHPFQSRARLVFAHRGGAKLAPENTLAAFDNGMSLGSDGFECDVHLSRDGVPVVIHDPTLERTTDATGAVGHRTATELAAVDAGHRFGGRPGIPVPRARARHADARAVLSRLPDRRGIIELKQGDPELARAVHGVLRRTVRSTRVASARFTSWASTSCARDAPACARARRSSRRAGRCTDRGAAGRSRAHGLRRPSRCRNAPGRLQVISPAFLRQAHRDGGRVDVWVVDDRRTSTRLFDCGRGRSDLDRPDLAVPTRDTGWPGGRRGCDPGQ